jgi:hypothetical protein
MKKKKNRKTDLDPELASRSGPQCADFQLRFSQIDADWSNAGKQKNG